MKADIDRILIPRGRIAERVKDMAQQIGELYADSEQGLVIVCILSGAIIFVADLIRQLPMKMRIALVTVSSYPGKTTESQGAALIGPLRIDVAGRDVLMVDDILDSGQTLRAVRTELARQQPASVRTCVLLRKAGVAPDDVQADIVGFDIENVFVVGYGLDYDGLYRNLPDIAVLKSHLYD
jgi:hypoxanthine phosphoribosyltransferase